MFVVRSYIKKTIKGINLRVSEDYIETLSDLVKNVMIASAQACKMENRATLKAKHVPVISAQEFLNTLIPEEENIAEESDEELVE
jgi:hypothetical protein